MVQSIATEAPSEDHHRTMTVHRRIVVAGLKSAWQEEQKRRPMKQGRGIETDASSSTFWGSFGLRSFLNAVSGKRAQCYHQRSQKGNRERAGLISNRKAVTPSSPRLALRLPWEERLDQAPTAKRLRQPAEIVVAPRSDLVRSSYQFSLKAL